MAQTRIQRHVTFIDGSDPASLAVAIKNLLITIALILRYSCARWPQSVDVCAAIQSRSIGFIFWCSSQCSTLNSAPL